MKKFFLALVFSLVLLSALAAARTSISAPAVDSQGNGVLTTISAEATHGNGRIRTDIRTSLISTDTENSIRIAAIAAAKEADVNLRRYDINIDIDSQAEIIDGPSGGLALGIIIYNELNSLKTREAKAIRGDLTVTGEIDREGGIIRVGGVEEKVQAAVEKNIKLMLVASGQSASDSVDYTVYAREVSNGATQLIEVPNLHSALQYVYTPQGSVIANAPESAIKPLELQLFYPTPRTLHLREIALEEIQNAQRQLETLTSRANRGQDGQLNAVIRAVNSSLRNAQNALDNGYFYTAANSAFLARITLETANAEGLSADEFAALISSLEAQQGEFQKTRPNLTSENFDLTAGADLRFWWSVVKLQEARENFQKTGEVTPGEARDYYTSKAWFQAAVKLMSKAAATPTGTPVEKANAREYALDLIEQAAAIANNSLDSEVQWHYKTSKRQIEEGSYTSAVFDLQFIFSIDSATKKLENKTVTQAMEMIGSFSNNNPYASPQDAMWAELYYAHSLHMMQENQAVPDPSTIVSTVRLRELAKAFNDAKATLANEFTTPRPPRSRASEIPVINAPANGQNELPRQQPQPTVTATVTQSSEIGDVSQLVAILLISIGVLVLVAIALNRQSTATPREMVDKLDQALAMGRISEPTYKRLRIKYAKLAKTKPKTIKMVKRKRHR